MCRGARERQRVLRERQRVLRERQRVSEIQTETDRGDRETKRLRQKEQDCNRSIRYTSAGGKICVEVPERDREF